MTVARPAESSDLGQAPGTREVPAYLLDTSAILALYQDEAGAAAVEDLFERRDRGDASIFVSFMTIFEIVYLTMSGKGTEEAFSLLFKIRSLGMEEVWPDEELLWRAAEVKADGGLSAAGAFIAASAIVKEAILVHEDPEFERLRSKVPSLSLMTA